MPLLHFLLAHRNQRVTAPGGIGGECVDLANLYLADVYSLPHVYANAVDWQAVVLPGWKWIVNSPMNAPRQGALVVWGESSTAGTGPYGHIAIAIDGDINEILSFDQNWPEGRPCEFVGHSYDGVLGWLTPPESRR